jgi:hypothetical protein
MRRQVAALQMTVARFRIHERLDGADRARDYGSTAGGAAAAAASPSFPPPPAGPAAVGPLDGGPAGLSGI